MGYLTYIFSMIDVFNELVSPRVSYLDSREDLRSIREKKKSS
jgi:hypothetical protein